MIHGKQGEKSKSPILSQSVRDNLRIKTFHSKADNLSDIDESYFTTNENDEEEILSQNTTLMPDQFLFSTFQTAILKNLTQKLPYVDLIIIDEAHNIKPDDEYSMLLQNLCEKGREGNTPMILSVTATPTNLTKELFGASIYTFGLAEYIASPYSPNIDYRLVPVTTATE